MMPIIIKAIVFKTTQLKATKVFFENLLNCQFKESSARHFVIHSKGVRLVFVDSPNGFELEMYVQNQSIQNKANIQYDLGTTDFKRWIDPNGITILTYTNT